LPFENRIQPGHIRPDEMGGILQFVLPKMTDLLQRHVFLPLQGCKPSRTDKICMKQAKTGTSIFYKNLL